MRDLRVTHGDAGMTDDELAIETEFPVSTREAQALQHDTERWVVTHVTGIEHVRLVKMEDERLYVLRNATAVHDGID